MAEEWFTYNDLAERLGISPEAARQKAIRARWPRRTANDGRTQVRVELADVLATTRPKLSQSTTPADARPPVDVPPPEPPSDGETAVVLAELRERLAGMVERVAELRAQAERERAEHQVAVDRERSERHRERDRADALADQVAELARRITETLAEAERRRALPWWRRLAG